jgi:predicted ATPase
VSVRAIRTPDQRLRVFISSTLGELADERRATRQSVEQLRLTPVMFELGARPHPPRALYRSYLAQSDVFVGIYWQRYGWIAPDMEISGLEDELVLSADMPRLVYVKRPAPDLDPRLDAMLERLQREDTASYKPFTDADELRDLVLDDLALLLTERFDDDRDVPSAPEPPRPRHNLPVQTSTFLGREAELRGLGDLLAADDVRLITLTGPGGSGKTRVAIRAAVDAVPRFADGVFFADLSAERQVDDAFDAVARAVGIPLTSDTRPLDALEALLRDRHVLLVLDNLEQVTPAAVGVIDLLQRCPRLKVLVTSREALHVRGERVFPVPPLSLPDLDDVRSAAGSEAVRLFCDRAGAVEPGFRLDDGNAEAITAICRRLDGLPLAIELAAARVPLFDVNDLRMRLEECFDVLRGGARDLPKRQQTLRDAITWSYDLLTDDERNGLRVFAVFADARLADVEEVAPRIDALGDLDVIETLGSLVDKSMVRSTLGSDGRPRFSMLQTIRAFATEQLDTIPGLAEAARRAHAEHYTELAAGLYKQLTLEGREGLLSALSLELANLRTAWDEWAGRSDVGRLNDLLAPLWGYYDARGEYRSVIQLGNDLLACLALTADTPDRRRDEFVVRLNLVRTELAVRGFTAEAERMIRDALDQAAAAEDDRQRFPGLRSLAYLHTMRSDFDQLRAVAGELMTIARQEQDPLLLSEAHLLVGLSRAWLDGLPASLDDYAKAVEHFEATRSGHVDFRVGPNPGVVINVVSALTQWMVGSPETASSMMQRALDVAADLDHPFSMAYALHHAGLLDQWRQDLDGVGARADALLAIAEAHDYPTWRALALVWGGMAMVGSGDADAGLARVEEGFEMYRGLSAPPVFWPALLMIRAAALGLAGRPEAGLAFIEEAEAVLMAGDPMSSDVGIVHGELLLAQTPPETDAAAAKFERSARFSRDHGARMAELQALTHLARLRRGTPGEADAVAALEELYGQFTEGFDTPQLVAARDVLRSET